MLSRWPALMRHLKRLKSRQRYVEIFTGDHRSAEAAGDHFVALPTVFIQSAGC